MAGVRLAPVGVTGRAGHASARAECRRRGPPGGFAGLRGGRAPLPCATRPRTARVASWNAGRPLVAEERHTAPPIPAAAPAAGGPRAGVLRRVRTPPPRRWLPHPCRLGPVAPGTPKAPGLPEVRRLVPPPRAVAAACVAVASRYRWATPWVCRWLPWGRGCRHGGSQTAPGVRRHVSVALLASRLLRRWLGSPPTTRTEERRWCALRGWASETAVSAPSARWQRKAPPPRCPFRKSYASATLGTPGSSPAPEATLERGAPRENPGELVVYL